MKHVFEVMKLYVFLWVSCFASVVWGFVGYEKESDSRERRERFQPNETERVEKPTKRKEGPSE